MNAVKRLIAISGRLLAASSRVLNVNESLIAAAGRAVAGDKPRDTYLTEAAAWSELLGAVKQARADLNVLAIVCEQRAEAARKAFLDADPEPEPRLHLQQRRMTRCQADDDGDCTWQHCPQLRDHEPASTGRHCPLDRTPEEEPEETPCTDPS